MAVVLVQGCARNGSEYGRSAEVSTGHGMGLKREC